MGITKSGRDTSKRKVMQGIAIVFRDMLNIDASPIGMRDVEAESEAGKLNGQAQSAKGGGRSTVRSSSTALGDLGPIKYIRTSNFKRVPRIPYSSVHYSI
jgi:hypothetical protein